MVKREGRRLIGHGLVAGCAVALCAASAAAGQTRLQAASDEPSRVEPGRVIVRYEPGAERGAARDDVDAVSARGLGLARTEVLRLPAGESVAGAVRELRARDDVAFAQPDYVYSLEGVPNDPAFGSQWGLNNVGQNILGTPGTPDSDIDAPEAWDVSTGSESILVGVIDSGVNHNHPDFAGNVSPNGRDFVHGDTLVSDDTTEHGTQVASVIGARGNNGIGVSGVAQRVTLLPLQAEADGGGILTSAVVQAIDYARSQGARIVNMSLGSFGGPDAGDLAMQAAIEASPGILFVTSAGNQDPATGVANNNDVKPHWPSNLTTNHANVIAVANTTNQDLLSAGSSFGATTVDLAAPGASILGANAASPVFSENFDGVTPPALPSGWTKTGTWATTGELFVSSPNSLADSPGDTSYAPTDTEVVTSTINVPAGASACAIDSLQRRLLGGGDFLRTDAKVGAGGFQLISTAGTAANTYPTEADDASATIRLTGPTTVQFRFRLDQNGDGLVGDGVHLDNVAVRCTHPVNAYNFKSGTSFSAPAVAGTAALMLAVNSNLAPGDLKTLIRNTADPVGAVAGKVSTNGRLNASRAVVAAAPPPPPRDLTAAVVRSLSLVPARFLPMRSGATVRSAALRRGSRLSFRVNEAVRARVQIFSRKAGRRVGRRCLANTRARRRRPKCTRYLSRGIYSLPGQVNGLVRRTFSGRLRGRALKPGPYRLRVLATDLAGNRSVPKNKNFTIAKPPRRPRRR
jgi:subtilisin family serine protease